MSRNKDIHLDDDELRNLEVDLRGAPLRVKLDSTKTLRKGAALVDHEMVVDATGHRGNWFGIPGTSFKTPIEKHVSHELLNPSTAEIGIEAKGAGSLAHILVYGSVKNAPVYDHTAGLRRAEPRIMELFADTAEEAVFGPKGDSR